MTEEKPRAHQGRIVRKEIEIRATPQQVWDAWAKAELIAQWFVDRCEGDMRAGDTVTWTFEAFGYRIPIDVYAAVAGERLVFGGEIPGRLPALQEVLVQHAHGVTRLRLANSGFGEGAEFDEELRGVDSGWELALAQLRLWLEAYGTRDRTHLLVTRPASHSEHELVPLFTTSAGLGSWLGDDVRLAGAFGVGARVRLSVPGAGPLDGRVLAASGREVLLEWPEQRGCVGLKAFAMGPARMVALDFNAWGLPEERRAGLRAALEAALGRLVAVHSATR